MQPNNTISDNIQTNTTAEADTTVAGVATGATTEAPQTTPMNPGKDIVFRDKPKKNVGAILGVILLILLAAGGAGFGTWAYLSGNQKETELNNQISDLKTQLENKQPTVVEETNVEVDGHSNPVIKSPDSEDAYKLFLNSSDIYPVGSEEKKSLMISVSDGKNVECTKLINGYESGECNITGLDGQIYKIVEFGEGHDSLYNKIGFIMADGTVKYFPLKEAFDNNDFSIRGNVKIDGFVTDIFEIGVKHVEDPGGYTSSIFVLNDGTYKKYDESMLE